MTRGDQSGAINLLLFPLIFMTLLFCGAAAFGYWAFTGRQDYKNNVDAKVQTAVAAARQDQTAKDEQAHAEADKSPLQAYTGPDAYGGLQVNYPKTWSAYVDDTGNGSNPVEGYFDPNTVPSITSQSSTFALRVEVINSSYSSVMQQYSSIGVNKQGTIIPYALPKVPKVVGSRLDGQVSQDKQGAMIILPIRDKTLKVWTEAQQYEDDFNNLILPNLSFSP